MRDRPRGGIPTPDLDDLPSVLHAQLDIQVHLIRDVLVGCESGASEILQRMHAERLRVLRKQSRTLWERMGARGRSDPRAIRLWVELGMTLPDAVLVALCFEVERTRTGEPVDSREFSPRVGRAYLRLLQRVDSFLPIRPRPGDEMLPLAVAVTSFRLARRRGSGLSWLQVEPVMHQVVEVLARE